MPKTCYNQPSYWEQRYKQTICEHYEWLSKPEPLIKIISNKISFDNIRTVMDIGCGTSTFLKHLDREIKARGGQCTELTAIDFSKEVIKKLRTTTPIEGANYICADVRNLRGIEDKKYDLIIDKGTIDCLFCEDGFIKEVLKGMRECYRILSDQGVLVIVSQGKPKFRHYLFRNKLVPFHLTIQTVPKTGAQNKELYIYICRKGEVEERQGAILQVDEQQEPKSDQHFPKEQVEQEKQSEKVDDPEQNDIKSAKQFDLEGGQEQEKGVLEQEKAPSDSENTKRQKLGQQHSDKSKEEKIMSGGEQNQKGSCSEGQEKSKSKEEDPQFILQQETQGDKALPQSSKHGSQKKSSQKDEEPQEAEYDIDDFQQI